MAQHGSRMNAAQLSVILAKEWKDAERSGYQREYQRLHDDYERRVREYEELLTEEQRDIIAVQKEMKRETKASKELRKTRPPVLPRNSANLYFQERSQQDDVKELRKTRKTADVFSDIFKEYRSLSESEKRKYLDMQEEDKSRFQHEFLIWFEGIQSNENLTKAAREQANAMRERLKALSYI